MVRIEGVRARTGEFVLGGIDLEVGYGEYFVMVGPTGAGKTVLLEVVAGLRRADCGSIFLNGRERACDAAPGPLPPHDGLRKRYVRP